MAIVHRNRASLGNSGPGLHASACIAACGYESRYAGVTAPVRFEPAKGVDARYMAGHGELGLRLRFREGA